MTSHDFFVMVCTAGGIYGAIRFDQKIILARLDSLAREFYHHVKHHGEKS